MDESGGPDPTNGQAWSLMTSAAGMPADLSFTSSKESSILNEFGWEMGHSNHAAVFDAMNQIEPDFPLSQIHSQGRVQEPPVEVHSSSVGSKLKLEVLNQSGSSSSSEDRPSAEKPTCSVGNGRQPPNNKLIPSKKGKPKGTKRIRQPRFAFMTRSEVDHLEDGYRWRKYGQKAVKNSPFPRSYYRCTNSKCTVKKRVERSSEDPSVVVTTYEGQHCHYTVALPRTEVSFTSNPGPPNPQLFQIEAQFHQQKLPSNSQPHQLLIHQGGSSSTIRQEVCPQSSNEGLLGDVVRPGIRS